MATEADIELVPALLKGIPALRTLQYADRNDVDLVVTGIHGPTGLGWLFLGSVTERITRNADVPVLTINLPDAESTVADAEQANEIAREALETEGYTDISFPKDPSRTHGSWIIRATNGNETFDVHINEATRQSNIVLIDGRRLAPPKERLLLPKRSPKARTQLSIASESSRMKQSVPL